MDIDIGRDHARRILLRHCLPPRRQRLDIRVDAPLAPSLVLLQLPLLVAEALPRELIAAGGTNLHVAWGWVVNLTGCLRSPALPFFFCVCEIEEQLFRGGRGPPGRGRLQDERMKFR